MIGPITKYKMMWGGEWRPVTNMFSGGAATSNVSRVTVAVLYVGPDNWVTTVATPGDIFERDDCDPETALWEEID